LGLRWATSRELGDAPGCLPLLPVVQARWRLPCRAGAPRARAPARPPRPPGPAAGSAAAAAAPRRSCRPAAPPARSPRPPPAPCGSGSSPRCPSGWAWARPAAAGAPRGASRRGRGMTGGTAPRRRGPRWARCRRAGRPRCRRRAPAARAAGRRAVAAVFGGEGGGDRPLIAEAWPSTMPGRERPPSRLPMAGPPLLRPATAAAASRPRLSAPSKPREARPPPTASPQARRPPTCPLTSALLTVATSAPGSSITLVPALSAPASSLPPTPSAPALERVTSWIGRRRGSPARPRGGEGAGAVAQGGRDGRARHGDSAASEPACCCGTGRLLLPQRHAAAAHLHAAGTLFPPPPAPPPSHPRCARGARTRRWPAPGWAPSTMPPARGRPAATRGFARSAPRPAATAGRPP
jgi:hypothetical protein